jgi:branched-chain amino acid transport system permease protein
LQVIVNILALGSIYALFSLGLSLAWGVADILNLAHGALFVCGALIAYSIGERVELPLVVLAPIVVIATGLVTVILDLVALSPIARRAKSAASRETAVLLATLGAAAILTNVTAEATNHQIRSISDGVYEVKAHEFGGVTVTNIQIVIILAGIVCTGALVWWVRRSSQGRALRAVAYDRSVTPLFGVNGALLSRLTLFVAGGLAGLAGFLLTIQLSGFDAFSGGALLLKAFAIIIVGGIGSVVGTAAAAFGLAAVEAGIFEVASGVPQDAAAFIVILLVLLIRPQGLFGATTTERV